MSTTRPLLKFEDLEIGLSRKSSTRTITEAEIVDFARQYDPQWFHTDPEAAKQSTFGEVVASGVHMLAIWRQLDYEINSDIDYVCGIGFDNFRLKNALRPGDTVHVTSRILSKDPSKSGKPRGTCVGYYEMRNQNDEIVMHFQSINLVHTRG